MAAEEIIGETDKKQSSNILLLQSAHKIEAVFVFFPVKLYLIPIQSQ
jgi:hypothetical protein